MWFKWILAAGLLTGVLLSCAPARKTVQGGKENKVELTTGQQDSTEYDLIITDPGFQQWFDRHYKPVWYYSNDYLATWNRQYVIAWNEMVRSPEPARNPASYPFIEEIDYRPDINYGLDVNYRLYFYFKYIEDTWGRFLRNQSRN